MTIVDRAIAAIQAAAEKMQVDIARETDAAWAEIVAHPSDVDEFGLAEKMDRHRRLKISARAIEALFGRLNMAMGPDARGAVHEWGTSIVMQRTGAPEVLYLLGKVASIQAEETAILRGLVLLRNQMRGES